MNTDGFDNYQKSLEYQSRRRAAADQHRLAQQGSPTQKSIFRLSRQTRQLLLAIIVIAFSFGLLTQTGSAQAREPRQYETGGGDLFHDSMLAFTLGHYHYSQANYEKALTYFEASAALLPEAALRVWPVEYANIYRMLGKTQTALEDLAGARLSFERYLALAGDTADPLIVAAV